MERLLKGWRLCCKSGPRCKDTALASGFPASVPGDVTDELMKRGFADDIQFADNYKNMLWINESDWEYSVEFELSADEFAADEIFLQFDGIDTFGEIFLNGAHMLSTDNMFLQYRLDIKPAAYAGTNELRVRIRSVNRISSELERNRYQGAFDSARLLIRKAQCHFGWDWAPDYKGTGIWQEVKLAARSRRSLEYTRVIARASGEITFLTELNYSVRRTEDLEFSDDRLRVTVLSDGAEVAASERTVAGRKNLVNLRVPFPKLWYPNGYGEQKLYAYRIELLSAGGELLDSASGRFGIREVEILREPIGENRLDFRFRVNGREIFLKGSNWVPAGILTGAVKQERYRRLVELAKEAGFNALRVWGGGIYEKDLFYDLCDEAGILVYHDFMFACGDIPDERDEFCRKVTREAVYQVRRLDGHACMLVWNGGNEIRQPFANSDHPEWGEYLGYLLAGVCKQHSGVPYLPSCPYSMTDWGNDLESGDCHKGTLILSAGDASQFRDNIVRGKPLTTESAVLGPCRLRNLRKFIPEERLWPINEIWNIHFVGNPYEPTLPDSFAVLQRIFAEAFFGSVDGVADFVKKAMLVHAEIQAAEFEFARADRKICGGALSWMYNDIWRNGTWSAVDYELEPKPVYYAVKRAFEAVSAYVVKRNRFCAAAVNDSSKTVRSVLKFGQRRTNGETLTEQTLTIELAPDSVFETAFADELCKDTDCYLFAEFSGKKNLYFTNFYRETVFETELEISATPVEQSNNRYRSKVNVRAKRFAKWVFLDAAEEFGLRTEDNFFDLEAGEERCVNLSCNRPFRLDDLSVKTFADEWKE